MNLKSTFFHDRRRILGAFLALVSLLTLGCLGSWPAGAGLAILFLSTGFLTLPDRNGLSLVLNLVWMAGCIFLSCCYPSWMLEYRFFGIDAGRVPLNFVCAAAVYGLLLTLTGRIRPAVITASGALLLLCVVNTFVFQFRGNELQSADFLSVRTAMNVAAGYSFHLSANMAGCILLWGWTVFLAGSLPALPKRALRTRTAAAVMVAVCVCVFFWKGADVSPRFWKKSGTLHNGYLLNFSAGLRDSFIQKPDNYEQSLAQLDARYPQQDTALPEELPDILVIMDESLADMRVLGSTPKTSEPVTPHLDSLTENTVRGFALSPVFGGSTANAEFELLTGCSMAFLPNGSIAYQQYLRRNVAEALPWLLQSYGYETMATHPYFESGWNRQTAYELLGFQKATFLGAYPEEDLIRSYVSDREMFQYLLDQLDREGDAPLFLFGVTIQNHGGYYEPDYTPTLTLEGNSNPGAEQYLSLIHETDAAVSQLLTALQTSPRKTIVLLFGDHFPQLETDFFQELHGGSFDALSDQILQYQVPFYLWANYDIPEQTAELTSLNYLAVYLLKAAGLPLSPYYQFLADVQQAVPAMNPYAVYTPEGTVLAPEQAQTAQIQWLDLYKAAQYRSLFS